MPFRLLGHPYQGTRVIGSPSVQTPGVNPGRSNLIAWWKMDEANGNALDAHTNGLTLTAFNAPGAVSGKVGGARELVQGSSQAFFRASEALLQTGDIAFTIGGWFYRVATNQMMITKSHTNAQEYRLRYNVGLPTFDIYNGVATQVGTVSHPTNVGFNIWRFIVAYHDPDLNLVGISMDGSNFTTSATTAPAGTSNAEFDIGAVSTHTAGFVSAYVDEVFFYKRILSLSEVLWLYNNGNGRTYSQLL